MNKRYTVTLTDKEREELEILIRKGRTQAYRIKHANILLKVDANGPNWTDEKTAKAFSCHCNTVRNVRQRFVEEGFEAALERNKQKKPSREKILDGEKEARLIAISRTTPPGGREDWTLILLANELVVQGVVDSISDQTVRRTLKKMNSSLTCGNAG